MKSTVVWIVFGTLLMGGSDPVSAWGGVFNRFTPELLGNLGYSGGGGGGNNGASNALFYEVSRPHTMATQWEHNGCAESE